MEGEIGGCGDLVMVVHTEVPVPMSAHSGPGTGIGNSETLLHLHRDSPVPQTLASFISLPGLYVFAVCTCIRALRKCRVLWACVIEASQVED